MSLELHSEYRTYFGINQNVDTFEVTSLLRDHITDDEYARAYRLIRDMDDTKWKDENGQRFPKRMRKLLKQNGIDISPFMGRFDQLGERYAIDSVELRFHDIGRHGINWRAGEYGDNGSCFWGCHSGAQDILQDNECYAIQYKFDGRKGRCWLAPYCDEWVIFNAYGPLQLHVIASLLPGEWNKCSLTNRGCTNATLYINSGSGFTTSSGRYVDLGFDDDSYRCECCGSSVNEDYAFHHETGTYCEECFCDSFTRCDYDDEFYPNSEMIEGETSRGHSAMYHEDNLEYADNYRCECCDSVRHIDFMGRDMDDAYLCEDCLDGAPVCDDCGCHCIDNDGVQYITIDGDTFCPNCREVEIVRPAKRKPVHGELPYPSHFHDELQHCLAHMRDVELPNNEWSYAGVRCWFDEWKYFPGMVHDDGIFGIRPDHNSSHRRFVLIHLPTGYAVGYGNLSQCLAMHALTSYHADWTSDISSDYTGPNTFTRALLAYRQMI